MVSGLQADDLSAIFETWAASDCVAKGTWIEATPSFVAKTTIRGAGQARVRLFLPRERIGLARRDSPYESPGNIVGTPIASVGT
jgi:hypothetical protein